MSLFDAVANGMIRPAIDGLWHDRSCQYVAVGGGTRTVSAAVQQPSSHRIEAQSNLNQRVDLVQIVLYRSQLGRNPRVNDTVTFPDGRSFRVVNSGGNTPVVTFPATEYDLCQVYAERI